MKFILKKDIKFNYKIIFDIIYLDEKLVARFQTDNTFNDKMKTFINKKKAKIIEAKFKAKL